MRPVPTVRWWSYSAPVLAALAVAAAPAPARAGFVFNVAYDDPGGTFSSFYADITAHVQAAGADWTNHFAGSGSLEVIVRFNSGIPRATGRSLTSSFVGFSPTNGRAMFEQGMAAEIRTGIDPNGASPDIELVFNPGYLANELWFDPDPVHRTAAVPTTRTDAMSVFVHELGHAIAFNGWRSSFDRSFTIPQFSESTFDERVFFDGTNFYFNGPRPTPFTAGPCRSRTGITSTSGTTRPGPART